MAASGKLAVLGLGSIGLRHARNALALGREVVGFDPNAACRVALEAAGGRAAETAEAALSEAWAAVVATPSGFHRIDLDRCLGSGVHVLVEKPLAHVLDGMDDLVDEFARRGLVLAAALNLRHRPVVATARRVLESGRLGRLLWARFLCGSFLPSWRPNQDYRQGYANDPVAGGIIFDAIHEFDLANHLLGPARTVTATSRSSGVLDLGSEDIADIVLAHEGGHHSALHLDYVTQPRRRQFDVCGSDGLLSADLTQRRLTLWAPDGSVLLDEQVASGPNDEYIAEMRDFLTAAEQVASPACTGAEALAVLRQACEARRLCGLPTSADEAECT